ncbi:peptidase [Roseobacteraceae bacterium S113]
MTYCVGMMLRRGIVFMSDTRTNAGLDNISSFKKMAHWQAPGERMLTLLSSGNLATTQSLISLLDERTKMPEERNPSLMEVPSMFQAARLVGETLRDVIAQQRGEGQTATDTGFNATVILGGQIAGSPPRLFLIYPEGNFIEAGEDTPFFQIGEIKYGRPILVRAYDGDARFSDALKLLCVSFDSTLKANLSVGLPLDYQCYETDSLSLGATGRIDAEHEGFGAISEGWGDALKSALDGLPEIEID